MRSTKAIRCRKSRLLTLAVAAASQALLARYAIATPRGAKVVSGSATIAQHGNVTVIHAANNSIIDFASFNIAQGQKVRIVEPSDEARVLEEVIGGAPTLIDGALRSNGQIFLVNPNGISFGSTSTINVGGLTAVAGELSHSDFLTGVNHFTNLTGPVSNLGQITASGGNVALAGKTVANNGSIAADNGTIVMTAGSDTYIGQSGSGIYAKVASESAVADTGGSGDVYSLALGAASRIRAQQVVAASAGATSASGSVSASSSATVTGNTVAISGATINAPTVNVGGGAHGQDASIADAVTTTVDSSSTINGGNVVIWSNVFTGFHGTINAPGGWVETSSAGQVDLTGSSINVAGGTWVLDPADVEITASTDNNDTQTGTNPTTFSSTGTDPTQVSASMINTALNSAADVIITTHSSLTDSGVITQDAGANISNTTGGVRMLTFEAAGGVTLNGGISASGSGNSLAVTMTAEDGVSATGPVVFNNGSSIATNGGALQIVANSITENSGVTITTGAGGVRFTTDTLSLGDAGSITTTGAVTFQPVTDADVQVAGSSAPGGTLFISQTDLSAFASGYSGFSFQPGSGNSIAIDGNVDTTGSDQTYGSDVTLDTSATLTGNNVTFDGTVNGNFALTVKDAATTTFGGDVTVLSLQTEGAGGVAIDRNVTTTGGQLYKNAVTLHGANKTISNSGLDAITFGSTVTSVVKTNLTITSSNSGAVVTFGGAVSGLGNLIVNGAGGDVFDSSVSAGSLTSETATTLGGNVTTTTGQNYDAPVTLVAGSNPTLSDTSEGSITFGSTVNGLSNLTVTTAGSGTKVEFDGTVGGNAQGVFALTVSGAGGNVFKGDVSAQSLMATGATRIDGNVTTNDGQDYAGPITLNDSNGSQTLTDGVKLTIGGNVGGTLGTRASGTATLPGTLTLNAPIVSLAGTFDVNSGTSLATIVGGSSVQTVDVNPGSSINVGISLLPATGGVLNVAPGPHTDAVSTTKSFALDNTMGVTSPVITSSYVISGPITLSGFFEASANAATFNDPVTLTGDTNVTATAANSGNVEFGQTLNGPFNLTVAAGDQAVFNGAVGGAAALKSITASGPTVQFTSTVNGATAINVTATTSAIFDASIGGTTPVTSVTASGPTTIDGNVTTTGGQTYNGAVTLDGSGTQTFTDPSVVDFASTLNGTTLAGQSLLVVNGGLTTFGGAVGGVFSLNSLMVEGPTGSTGSGTTQINSGITTTGTAGQVFVNAVTVGTVASLNSGAGPITFDSTVDGDTTGADSLTVQSGGATTFKAAVGGTVPLSGLTVETPSGSVAGTAVISGGLVNTTGSLGQTYDNPVVITTNTTLNAGSSGAVFFSNTVQGFSADSLTVESGQTTTFNGNVSALGIGIPPLASLTVEGPGGSPTGITEISANNISATNQVYRNKVVVVFHTVTNNSTGVTSPSPVALNAGATGAITFDGRVDSGASGAEALTITNGGTITFEEPVGGKNALASLTVTSPTSAVSTGSTAINGGSVTTSGTAGQVYQNSVTLGTNTTFKGEGASPVTFDSTVNGATSGGQSLLVRSGGAITFTGAVGGIEPLSGLSTKAVAGTAGTVTINGGSVVTTGSGGQVYSNPFTFGSDTTLNAGASGPVTFGNVVNASTDGGASLTVISGNVVTFENTVATTGRPDNLTVENPAGVSTGTVDFDFASTNNTPEVFTSGNQTFDEQVVLNSDAGFVPGGVVTFESQPTGANGTALAIFGPTHNVAFGGTLQLSGAGSVAIDAANISFDAPVTSVGTPPTLILDGNVNSGGSFTSYGGPVESTSATASEAFPGIGVLPANGVVTTSINGIEFAEFGSVIAFNTEVDTLLATYVPVQIPPPLIPTTEVSPAQSADLEKLGIYVKTTDEIQDEFAGQSDSAIIIVDWPPVPQPGPEDRKVTPRRFESRDLLKILSEARSVWPAFPDEHTAVEQLAAGIVRYRAEVNPPDGKVSATQFAQFVAMHEDSNAGRELAIKLRQMRKLADNIAALGLSPAESRGSNQAWANSTPDDSNLVNDSGQTDPYWLYDVIETIPASAVVK